MNNSCEVAIIWPIQRWNLCIRSSDLDVVLQVTRDAFVRSEGGEGKFHRGWTSFSTTFFGQVGMRVTMVLRWRREKTAKISQNGLRKVEKKNKHVVFRSSCMAAKKLKIKGNRVHQIYRLHSMPYCSVNHLYFQIMWTSQKDSQELRNVELGRLHVVSKGKNLKASMVAFQQWTCTCTEMKVACYNYNLYYSILS